MLLDPRKRPPGRNRPSRPGTLECRRAPGVDPAPWIAAVKARNAVLLQIAPLADAVARERGVRAPVALRVNPDVDAKTHAKITTGKAENKFGIPLIRAQIPKRIWKTKKQRGRPINVSVPRFQAERTFAWFQKKYRRLVVRWERIAAGFEAFRAIASIHIWVHRLIVG